MCAAGGVYQERDRILTVDDLRIVSCRDHFQTLAACKETVKDSAGVNGRAPLTPVPVGGGLTQNLKNRGCVEKATWQRLGPLL